MQNTNCNPLISVIEELKEKELIMPKGANMHSLVRMDDAIKVLEELEVRIWACCEAEMLRKHMLNNQENY